MRVVFDVRDMLTCIKNLVLRWKLLEYSSLLDSASLFVKTDAEVLGG